MDELVNLVSEKAGISNQQAITAVETVIGYMKEKLPEPLAGQVESAMGGGGATDSLGGLTKGLGGMLGK